MDQKIRRQHSPAFKAKVAIEAIRETKTIAQLSGLYQVHSTQITKWKTRALEIITQGFSQKQRQREKDDLDLVQELYRQIGKLKVEVDFLKKKMGLFGE
jgi:transposase-like protein